MFRLPAGIVLMMRRVRSVMLVAVMPAAFHDRLARLITMRSTLDGAPDGAQQRHRRRQQVGDRSEPHLFLTGHPVYRLSVGFPASVAPKGKAPFQAAGLRKTCNIGQVCASVMIENA